MKALCNGTETRTYGQQPKAPTAWWGSFTFWGNNGQATEVKWSSKSPLTFPQAMEALNAAMEEAEGIYAETHQEAPTKMAFMIECR